jgi:ribulose-5-phosphate 4-epimerase/fuculose-1-phosphate aldolase
MLYFDFFTAARYVADKGLVCASSGNMSYRFHTGDEDEKMWITASGAWLGTLDLDDYVECDFPSGDIISAPRSKKPSTEFKMHLEILKTRKDVSVVLHFQSPYATTLAASNPGTWIDLINVIPEVPFYLGRIGLAEYCTPGSIELATKVAASILEHDAVMMQNHGQVVVGDSFTDVINKASFLELASQIVVGGNSLKLLSCEQQQDLIKYRNIK